MNCNRNTAMEALIRFSSPSSYPSILQTKRSVAFEKAIFCLPSKYSKIHLLSNCSWNKSKYNVFSSNATSPSIATTPSETDPTGPDLKLQAEKEKFNWYEQWYPLAPVCDLDKRVPHAKKVMGLDVVVWWDRVEEKWQVFEDRCPHRMAPLYEGRIDQWGRLQCVYNGWCFDGAGNCKFIPYALPTGPLVHTFKKACTVVYPSCEQHKIVWFWPSAEPQYKDILMKEKTPYIPELDDPLFSYYFTMRELPYGPKSDREGGMPLENKVEKMNIDGFLATDQVNGYSKFISPLVFYAFPKGAQSDEFTSSKSTQQESSANSVQMQRMVLLVFFCIPVSPCRSRLIWVFPRNFFLWSERIIPRWVFHVKENLVADGDVYVLHMEERRIAKVGASNWLKTRFIPTKADALVVGFRKWLRKYSDNQIDWRCEIDRGLLPSLPSEKLMDRYWSHVVHCTSRRRAEKGLKALEISLQVISVASIGIVATLRQNMLPMVSRSVVVSMALVCFLASKWLPSGCLSSSTRLSTTMTITMLLDSESSFV